MDSSEDDRSPDHLELIVEGFAFSVVYDASQPGTYHYTRLPGAPGGPAVGYGFSSRRSDHRRDTTRAHVEAIHDFISIVDPVTGHIEDTEQDGEDTRTDE